VLVVNDGRPGRQSTDKWQKKLKIFENSPQEYHRWTIHELADTTGINYGVCQEILRENLNMRHTATKFVSWLLTNDQKQRYINSYLELRGQAKEVLAFTHTSSIITADESWIYGYDPETKQQSSQWKNPQSPRANK
jgi:hypothetical protein